MRAFVVLSVILALCALCVAQGNNCQGTPNNNVEWFGTPTFESQVTNGKLFWAGEEPNNTLPVLHLYGTPYEMGFAHGTLLTDDIREFYNEMFNYLELQIAPYLSKLPKAFQHIIEQDGIIGGLQLTADLTKSYTPPYFFEEMQGIADATGIAFETVVQMHMYPELIKAACTMVGAWGQAVNAPNGTEANGLIQLRALDQGIDNPMRRHPLLIVYHTEEGNGQDFSILSWSGFIGAITGYGSQTGICEKVWLSSNETLLEGRIGIPWHFLLRDILQFDQTIAQAEARMTAAKRTAAIFVGVGSRQDGQFIAAEYSFDQLHFFGPQTPFPGFVPTPPEHPLMNDLVYIDKHNQPSTDPCTADLLQGMYGSITAQSLMSGFVSVVQTGDLQIGVYDYAQNIFHVAVPTQYNITEVVLEPAYNRQFLAFNMTAMYLVPAP